MATDCKSGAPLANDLSAAAQYNVTLVLSLSCGVGYQCDSNSTTSSNPHPARRLDSTAIETEAEYDRFLTIAERLTLRTYRRQYGQSFELIKFHAETIYNYYLLSNPSCPLR
jgi:hypothetical protein